MKGTRAGWLSIWLAGCAAACSSPISPTPPGYAGEWVGTTQHGSAVSFSVVAEDVTAFTVAFNLPPTCVGTETILGPRRIVTDGGQVGFVISKVHGNFEWGVAAAAAFSSDRRSASGEIQMMQYPGCGGLKFSWSATRR